MVIKKRVLYFGVYRILTCDGNCAKAWGIGDRPENRLSDEDDFEWLADDELPTAPELPGTWEGGHTKPCNRQHEDADRLNKWCARACERSVVVSEGQNVVLGDFSKRMPNQTPKNRAW